jgi:hypothetical protein
VANQSDGKRKGIVLICLTLKKKKKILDRQQIASQWGLQLIFRMHNSDPTPQGVENMTERIFNALHTQTFDPSFVHWRLI